MTTSTDLHVYPAIIAAGGPLACTAWDEFGTDENLRPSTRKNYRILAARFLRELEPQVISLVQITPAVVQSYLDRQPSSYRKYLCQTPLRRLFDSLVRQGVLTSNPAAPANKAQALLANPPFQKPLSPEDDRHNMLMLLVLGFNRQHEILEERFGKNSPQYKAQMAPVVKAFDKLIALLPERTTASAGKPSPETPDISNRTDDRR